MKTMKALTYSRIFGLSQPTITSLTRFDLFNILLLAIYYHGESY